MKLFENIYKKARILENASNTDIASLLADLERRGVKIIETPVYFDLVKSKVRELYNVSDYIDLLDDQWIVLPIIHKLEYKGKKYTLVLPYYQDLGDIVEEHYRGAEDTVVNDYLPNNPKDYFFPESYVNSVSMEPDEDVQNINEKCHLSGLKKIMGTITPWLFDGNGKTLPDYNDPEVEELETILTDFFKEHGQDNSYAQNENFYFWLENLGNL